MNKVTVEITAKGWETKVEMDGKISIEKHKRTPYGATSEGDRFEQNDTIDDDLLDALESINAYDTMKVLWEMEECLHEE